MTGLYVHIPFCLNKCSYCDFYSVVPGSDELLNYPNYLNQHLAWAASQGWQGPFETIYFGGGTPSLLSPRQVATILKTIDHYFSVPTDAEISFEINPGTVAASQMVDYRSAGINRVSIGVQSLEDRFLQLLGRQHDRKLGLSAYEAARAGGFDNISLDLMFALPGQSLAEMEKDLQLFLELGPEHLSCYGLTIEPNTALKKTLEANRLSLPDENLFADMFKTLHERLTSSGYRHYEIANYAKDGFACQHNLGYWQRRTCLGIGAGAHSFDATGWGQRLEVPPALDLFYDALQNQKEPMVCLESFDRQSALKETVYLSFRTEKGISDQLLREQFGCTLAGQFPDALRRCDQWLINDAGKWSMTPDGWLIFDRLIQAFL